MGRLDRRDGRWARAGAGVPLRTDDRPANPSRGLAPAPVDPEAQP
jgi:hypothetical protein